MSSLDQIVLPLAESRALVEHGVKLDTAMSWYPVDPPEDGEIRNNDKTEFVFQSGECDAICPAPTLSELLDAIRARVGDAEFHSYKVNTVVNIGERTWEMLGDYIGVNRRYNMVERAPAPTDLLAAYALLLEVAK